MDAKQIAIALLADSVPRYSRRVPLPRHTARVYLGKSTFFYPMPQLLKDLS